MMSRRIKGILHFSLVLVFAGGAFAQGVTWEAETTGGNEKDISKSYYMPRKVKIEQKGNTIIFRLDQEKMITVNDEDKTYSEISFNELEQMMKQVDETMSSKMAEIKEQMASMPEEQRKMMEKMMAGQMGGMMEEPEVKNTGETKTINGYKCTKYIVLTGGKETFSVWTTKDVKEFAGMQKDMEEFGKRMAAMTPRIGKSVAAAMTNLEGFPIQQEMAGMRTTVLSVKKENSPASIFDPPAGYKRVKSEMMEGMEKMKK
jgi:GLPGLI family protein